MCSTIMKLYIKTRLIDKTSYRNVINQEVKEHIVQRVITNKNHE
jgi:hypothetical protein